MAAVGGATEACAATVPALLTSIEERERLLFAARALPTRLEYRSLDVAVPGGDEPPTLVLPKDVLGAVSDASVGADGGGGAIGVGGT